MQQVAVGLLRVTENRAIRVQQEPLRFYEEAKAEPCSSRSDPLGFFRDCIAR